MQILLYTMLGLFVLVVITVAIALVQVWRDDRETARLMKVQK